ncbi:hypothetical protein Ahy_B03g067970 [Arachis hypogaea]|uniref:Transposase MuDR plant domain-containing protein n=1 Tax=Arachis hypogaea TaxID=3818 RepID=A0A445A8L5_ARAHY|nr:hypothetical protein Ahy_B03g067970 [Arachis hypogaea]
MGSFTLTVYHGVDLDMKMGCCELRQFGYTKENISAMWYKDLASQWLEKTLKLFATDKDALKMCKIANLRGHVEVFVVHVVEDAEEFPEAGFINVGGQTEEMRGNELVVYEGEKGQEVKNDDVQQGNEGDKLETDVAAENERTEINSDDNSDDDEFIPSDPEVDSADNIQFTDSDEKYDDESGFEEDTSAKNSKSVDKGKRVMNVDFSDEEVFNSDEVDLEYEVGVGSDDEEGKGEDNNETRSYPIHKDCKDMSSYKWEVGTVFASRHEFKDAVTSYAVQTRRGLRYVKLDLHTNFDDVMPPPYRKPSHRPVKKRKRGPDESETRCQIHLSKRGQIQRCSKYGALGHKRGRCSNPPLPTQPPKQTAAKKTNGGRKISQPAVQSTTRGRKRSKPQEKLSSQPQPAPSSTPITRSKSSHSQPIPKPTTHASRPNSTPAATPKQRPKMKPIRSST